MQRSLRQRSLRQRSPRERSLRILGVVSFATFFCAQAPYAQDTQSLGDAARQARVQKQQKEAEANNKGTPAKDASQKDAQSKDPQPAAEATKTAKKIITNDEIPEHVGPTRAAFGAPTPGASYPQPTYGDGRAPADYWKSQIQAQKSNIASMESQIKSLTDSIQYAGANCVANCVQWNERQQQKQAQAEAMKAQLEEQQKRLEDMQEMARKQGYGSSVYDP